MGHVTFFDNSGQTQADHVPQIFYATHCAIVAAVLPGLLLAVYDNKRPVGILHLRLLWASAVQGWPHARLERYV